MNYKTLWKGLLPAVAITAACGSVKQMPAEQKLELPAAFEVPGDTLAASKLNLKDFFSGSGLLSLIDTALANNPDMGMAVERMEIARINMRQSKAALFPTVEAVASAGVQKFGDYTLDGVGNYDTNLSPNINNDQRIPDPTGDFFLGLRSSWEVDLWGKLKGRKKAAAARFLASAKGRQLVATALTAQVAAGYYELVTLDDELEVIRRNIELQEHALEISKLQKLGGRSTELAVQQFQAQLHNTRSLQYSVTQRIRETENQLNYLLGRYPQPIERDSSALDIKGQEKLLSGLPSHLLLNRPDVQQAELELVASRADLQTARAAFFPSLTLTPFVGYNAFKAGLLFKPGSLAYGVLGGLTAPVFGKREIRSNFERQLAENRAAFLNYQKVVLDGVREVTTNLEGMSNLREVYRHKENEVNTLHHAVEISRDLYLAGRASYLEVITAQKSVLQAELELIEARKGIFLTSVGLYRALGGGWK